jgi:hypothetical protein
MIKLRNIITWLQREVVVTHDVGKEERIERDIKKAGAKP